MANFAGYTKKASIPRFIGQVEWDDPVQMPLGVAMVCRNMVLREESVRTRPALVRALLTAQNYPVSGLGLLKFDGSDATDVPAKYPVIYDQAGHLWIENPQGSGTLVSLNSSLLQAGLYAQTCMANDNLYIAQSDLITGQSPPLVISGKRADVNRYSELPLGSSWEADTQYVVGDIISPTVSNNLIYRCEVPGVSGNAEPAWPTDDAATVNDGAVTWKECTPFMAVAVPAPAEPTAARVAGAGTFPVGRDVYIKTTLVNGNGETSLGDQAPAVFVNTVLNDAFQVTRPASPAWDAANAAPYKLTNWNIYEADVATGTAEPDDTQYKLVTGGPADLTVANFSVTAAATGVAGPTQNTAALGGPGNICSGRRWAIVLFENNNGYIDGCTNAIPIATDAPSDGYELFMTKIPLGRENTQRRIIAFTLADDNSGKAGRYFYIADDDRLYPSSEQLGAYVDVTKTTISDNVTTTVRFNFPDAYLANVPTEATDYFNKQMVPSCVSIVHSKALNRMVLTGVPGYPSGHWVSDENDPETFYLPDCELEISENDGYRTLGWAEVDQSQYSLKENGGYLVNASGPTPSKWPVPRSWEGSGPCGPRAFDTTDKFLIYAHTTGLYIMANQAPVHISPELQKTWDRMNQAYKHLVQVKIDQKAKEVHVLMPVDGSTRNNLRIRLKVREWGNLTDEPTVFSVRMARQIPNVTGRKWSVDPIDVGQIDIWDRDLTVSVDQRIDHRQVIYASNLPEGLLRMERPEWYSDEDAAGVAKYIDWKWDSVYADNPGEIILGLGGVTISALGSGKLSVSAISHGDPILLTEKRECVLDPTKDNHWDLPARSAYDEHWGISFSGDGTPGSWAELHGCIWYMRAAWATRKG